MLERLRAAWQQFKEDGEEKISLNTRARHAAQIRVAAELRPQPDHELMQRIITGGKPRFYRRAV